MLSSSFAFCSLSVFPPPKSRTHEVAPSMRQRGGSQDSGDAGMSSLGSRKGRLEPRYRTAIVENTSGVWGNTGAWIPIGPLEFVNHAEYKTFLSAFFLHAT